ncbi:MAG: molybdate ABC transporter substrate-binding protein [Hungatella sp.]|nr:molybdate ABC transporter substrate-binding protein [Hungatella sp.]
MTVGSLAGCGGTAAGSAAGVKEGERKPEESAALQGGETVELIVFAAASMTETMTEIAGMYREIRPDVEIVCTFDSSGTLKTQIQEGADCDIFISAAGKQMDQLDITADPEVNRDGLDFVDEDTRFDLVENKVVLAVPNGNPAGIETFEDLGTDRLGLICLGNEDVPVGAYSEEILTNLGILDKLEADSKITYGSDVKEVTTQVKQASVDCGIIYATDAYSAGLTVVDEADGDLCRSVIYPAAVLKISKNREEARAFLDYLSGEDCGAVFESAGFSMAE